MTTTPRPVRPPLPALTLVDEERRGILAGPRIPPSASWVRVKRADDRCDTAGNRTVRTLMRLVGDDDAEKNAVIFVDDRVSRTWRQNDQQQAWLPAFPRCPFTAWDPNARMADDRSADRGPAANIPAGAGHAHRTGPGRLGARGQTHPRALCRRDRRGRTPVAGDDAVGTTRRVLPRVESAPGAQRAVDGRTDRRAHLEHLGQLADAARRPRHGWTCRRWTSLHSWASTGTPR